MADYIQIYDLIATPDGTALRNKISVAAAIKAQTLIDGGSPTAAQIAWANDAIKNPSGKAQELIHYVLAANNSATIATINAASDATIQSNVDTAVDALIAGGA